MPLSTSRQQFLAYEANGDTEIHYGRKGGVFISTCICISFIIFAVLIAILIGIIVFYITYFKVSQRQSDFWDEEDPFAQTSPSPDLRLPSYVTPKFYRLKIKADLEQSYFYGDVYITVRANKRVREIILHSKNLSIKNATLIEQIYEKVETLHTKVKRDVNNEIEQKNVTSNLTSMKNETIDTLDDVSTKSPLNNTNNTLIETTSVKSIDTQVIQSNLRSIKIISLEENSGDRLKITLGSVLALDTDYTLQLSFEGNISNYLNGFYKSSYTDEQNVIRNLGVTQFEPISARAAFPCFDEPAFKAKFEISIGHTHNISVLSNMKVASQEPIVEEPGWQWTHFERSVNMSTYLVAYVLTDFKYVETSYLSKDNVTKLIRVWARPSFLSKANYALNITPKLLSFYEDVFGVPYALDKLDLIAIPDFSSGAMENWGLITFRETTLLFDEKEGVPREKQNVAIDIAHELAHQWFGNLVTMRWWTDLWLNEGFATYIEYVGVNYVERDWNILESFTQEKMNLLRSDALKNTSPVSRQVLDAGEIAQKFDEISYSKGANLIRMLNHTISEELFRKGLLIYLNEWKYRNAEENDLWAAMSEATKSDPALKDLSMVNFMNSWTRQAGYPIVDVRREYDTGRVNLQQKLFSSTESPRKTNLDQVWRIPVTYYVTDTSAAATTSPSTVWLNEKTLYTELAINSTQALYVNVDAIGYYRVNYDQRNWELLDEAIKAGSLKNPVTRAQLIDDAFNLAKANQLNYSHALQLSACVMKGEDSKLVWDLLLNNMIFLKYNLQATSGYIYFQDYMKKLLDKQLQKLNYGLDKPKDDNEAFLIENLMMWDCLVESPRCLSWARSQFDLLTQQNGTTDNPIPSYLRPLVYNMAIKHGGRREFEFFWNMFLNSTDPNLQNLIISNLPSTNVESLITLLLERSLDEIPKQYAVQVWNVEPPVGTRLAQAFLVDNFQRVYDRFTNMDPFMFQSVINGAFGSISSAGELDTLKQFSARHKEQLKPMSQTIQKLVDTASLRIAWIKRHAKKINLWFQNFDGGANPTELPNSTTSEVPPTLAQNTTSTGERTDGVPS